MSTVEVQLSDEIAARLHEVARRLGVSPEELLRISPEEKLAQLDDDFRAAADYVLAKNVEL